MSIIEIRVANRNDSFHEIAECIYDTDPFIYPTAFGCDKRNAILAISELMAVPGSLFSYTNMLIAVTDGRVCGVLLYNEYGSKWDTEKYYLHVKNFTDNKQNFEYASTHYFLEEAKKPAENHIEIVAVCVSPAFRKRGIARQMLTTFIEMKSGKTLELDVLSNNESAVRLYSRCSFKITAQYKGFGITEDTRPDCYHMVRDS